MNQKYRLAIFMANPVHYKIDLYKELNNHPEIEVMVYFGSTFGIKQGLDKTFGKIIKWYDEKILDGLPHKFLKNYPFNKSDLLIDNPLEGAINLGIIPELIKNRYDAVLVDGYMMITDWLIFITAWLIKTPIIFKGDLYLFNKRSRFTQIIKKIILPLLFKNLDGFLGYSTTNIDYYKYYGVPENKIFFAPYAVNNNYFQKKHNELIPRKEEIKKAEGINPKLPVIISTSKLILRKRPMDLLMAHEVVNKKIGNKAQLIFVGDGPEKEHLEKYVQLKNIKNVYFAGFKTQDELLKYYSIADIFVLPSEVDIWGLVVNEAMNFALPIIATDMVGATYDVVEIGKNGYVYKVGDTDKLSEYLIKLIENKSLRKKMGKKSLKIINRWSYKQAISGIIKTVEAVKKPKVIVAQPGSHFLHQTAIGIQRERLLKYYVTGIYYKPNKFPYFLIKLFPKKIKSKINEELKRRRYNGLNDLNVKTFGFYEWLYILNSRLIKSKSLSNKIIEKRNSYFSKKVGHLVKKEKVKILWSGMDGSLEAFLIAKQNNIKCILDQFIGHPASLNKILDEEEKMHPLLKNISKERLPDDKIKRFAEEVNLADFIAAGSEFVKKTLLENGVPKNKITVIPYGANTNAFTPKHKKQNDNILKLLFVGNISVRKGCHYLLEAIKQLNHPNIKLTMIGRMEDKYFIDKYENYFKWVPPIPYNQLHSYYNKADVFVFPSLFEGSALVIYEALASSLPVITTENSGSIVRDGKDGFIIPIRNIEAVKEKILLLYNNEYLRKKIAVNARKQAEKYDWENYRQKVVKLIKKI